LVDTTNPNTVRLTTNGPNFVIPAKAGIPVALELNKKVSMDPSFRWGDGMVVCRLTQQYGDQPPCTAVGAGR
jgi:hypothetical protein